jgi:hypothetical protein
MQVGNLTSARILALFNETDTNTVNFDLHSVEEVEAIMSHGT